MMRRVKCITIVLLFGLLIGFAHAQDTVMLSNVEWAPYSGEKLPHFGLASQIVTEAFEYEGVKVAFKWYGTAWKTAYLDARKGKVDGTLIWSKSDTRLAEMHFSDVVIPGEQHVFFYLKDKEFDWNTIDHLKGLKLGGVLDFEYGPFIEDAEIKGHVVIDRFATEPKTLLKLLEGRIDLFLSNKEIGLELINNNLTPEQAAKITFHPKPFHEKEYHLLLTKSRPESAASIEKFNKGLAKLKASGKYDQYLREANEGK